MRSNQLDKMYYEAFKKFAEAERKRKEAALAELRAIKKAKKMMARKGFGKRYF